MKKIIFFIGILLILCSAMFCFGRARSRGYTYHHVQVVDECGNPVTGITSVSIYQGDGCVTDANAFKDASLVNQITMPMTSSSTNTTLSSGTFNWWGPDNYSCLVTDGDFTTVVKDRNASTNRIVMTKSGTERRKHTIELFEKAPIVSTKSSGGGAATGTGGDENFMILPGGWFEYHIIGTQTILQPIYASTGLNISMDQTDGDGVEISQGISALDPMSFTVGTDPDFFVRTQFSVADISGANDLMVGFRKAEAYQADNDDYDELVALDSIAGTIKTVYILNNADTGYTDTTWDWKDAGTHTFQVNISSAGVASFLVDGSTPPTVSTFTFDDAEEVVPFIYFNHNSDVAGAVTLLEYECGHQ